jgi:hypothetical protein
MMFYIARSGARLLFFRGSGQQGNVALGEEAIKIAISIDVFFDKKGVLGLGGECLFQSLIQ